MDENNILRKKKSWNKTYLYLHLILKGSKTKKRKVGDAQEYRCPHGNEECQYEWDIWKIIICWELKRGAQATQLCGDTQWTLLTVSWRRAFLLYFVEQHANILSWNFLRSLLISLLGPPACRGVTKAGFWSARSPLKSLG